MTAANANFSPQANQFPETLYHYTDSAVLVSIIQNRALRLSARWHLNDSREGLGFTELLEEYALANNYGKQTAESATLHLDTHHFYGSCFSSEGDLLSQWRAYAKDGAGVSIGFNVDQLLSAIAKQSEMLLFPVTYADSLKDLGQGQTLTALQTICTHPVSPPKSVLQALSKIRWAVKRKTYEEEKEYRLIFTPQSITAHSFALARTTLERKFFGATSEIKDCFDVKFGTDDFEKMITEVVIGPKNRSNVPVLKDFLASNGLPNTQVRISRAHYR